MFRSALLALDLSPAEQPLLGCMSELLKWGITRLYVVHVVRIGYGQGPGFRELENTTHHLETQVAPLRQAGLEVVVSVRQAGVPADEILAAATAYQVDMVVAGSRSHHMAHQVFLGSVARSLAHKTQRPLLLHWLEPDADRSAEHCHAVCKNTLRRVLLATDFSRQAGAAERTAIGLAGRATQVDCLHVVSPQAVHDTPALPLMGQAALADIQRQIAAAGGHGECSVIESSLHPSQAIAEIAGRSDHSLVIVGKHGQHWVKSVLIGSTASRLCESAGRPVLLVPNPDGP